MLLFLKPAFNIFKKVLLVVIVYFAVISLFNHFFVKDKAVFTSKTDPILENRKEIYKVINDKELNKTQQGKITIAVYRGMMCSMLGEACTNNPADGDKNFNKSGLGFISKLITLPFSNPPASGFAWTYSGLANAGFFPKALAAEGIGMGSIQPFAKIWKIFRDVTYLLLVIVLIAIGFMVMFRTKINPQTVISVENSLPKIIIALILITFSFAIAGFMIDLMYLLIAVITSILGPVYMSSPSSGVGIGGTGLSTTAELQKYYLTADLGALYKGTGKLNDSMWGTFLWRLPNAILDLIPGLGLTIRIIGGGISTAFSLPIIKWLNEMIIEKALRGLSEIEPGADGGIVIANAKLSAKLSAITDPFLSGANWIFTLALFLTYMTIGIDLLLGVIIWFSLVFVFFRIFLLLINSYIKILLSIILSPIYLLFEAIPGQSAFMNWIKNLAGELIVFPSVVGIFVLGTIIADSASSGNLVQFPFMLGIDPKSFGYIVGIILFFMTPDLVKAIRQIFIPKPGILDAASPGALFGGVGPAVGGIMGGAGQIGSISLLLSGIGRPDILQNLAKKFGIKPPPTGPGNIRDKT